MRIRVLLAVVGLSMASMVLLSCGSSTTNSGSGGGPGDAMFDIKGNWQIITTSQSGASGGAGGVFQGYFQNNSFTGTLSNLQPACASSAALNGNVNRTHVTFSLNENGQSLNFDGSISATGQLNGTYTSSSGGCTNGDSGTWTATRIPAVTGNWSGTLTPDASGQLAFQLAGTLNQDLKGNVSGSANVTGSGCFSALALSTPMPIAGQKLVIMGQDQGGSAMRLTGQVDPTGSSMTVDYVVTGGTCNAQTGTGTLKKQ